mmetsp:Transcript_8961/g.11922  ORF Transcript_8961/g.11922 Transcript_8961/m.11922 type:complete len:202 (-) Transcript_8961:8-613(-)
MLEENLCCTNRQRLFDSLPGVLHNALTPFQVCLIAGVGHDVTNYAVYPSPRLCDLIGPGIGQTCFKCPQQTFSDSIIMTPLDVVGVGVPSTKILKNWNQSIDIIQKVNSGGYGVKQTLCLSIHVVTVFKHRDHFRVLFKQVLVKEFSSFDIQRILDSLPSALYQSFVLLEHGILPICNWFHRGRSDVDSLLQQKLFYACSL